MQQYQWWQCFRIRLGLLIEITLGFPETDPPRLKWVPGRSRRKFKIADVVSEP
jgi:hypothetical protein